MAIVVPGHTAATEGRPELYPEHRRTVVEWAPGGLCTPRRFLFLRPSLIAGAGRGLVWVTLSPEISLGRTPSTNRSTFTTSRHDSRS
jgi:hypothetical protein